MSVVSYSFHRRRSSDTPKNRSIQAPEIIIAASGTCDLFDKSYNLLYYLRKCNYNILISNYIMSSCWRA